MSQDYKDGFREALRVLKRDVDASPRWGAGDIYERLSELLEGGPVLAKPVSLDEFVDLREKVAALDRTLTDYAKRLAVVETRPDPDYRGRLMAMDRDILRLQTNVAGHEKQIGELELVVASPDAPNRALVSVVARVEQLEKNGSSDAESINELSRKMGLLKDALE